MAKRAVIDLASLRRMRGKRDSLRERETLPYSEDLRSVMVGPVLTCPLDASVREAVKAMTGRGVSSVVAVGADDAPVGILTESDIIRRVVADPRVDIASTRLSEVMTTDPVFLSPGDSIYRALFVLSSRGVKHLPLVEDGRAVGIVTHRQLLKLRYPEPLTLIAGITGASTVDALGDIKAGLPGLVARKLAGGARAFEVVTMLSQINQDIFRRTFELAIDATGEPPADCCLFVTGSNGRLENLLSTDQDHGLILADVPGADERVAEYYATVATTFSDWLERIGFEKCPGEVMAVNPTWRKTLAGWKHQLDHWIVGQVEHLTRYVTVFFDAMPIHGDGALFRALQDHAFDLLGKHYEVLRFLHEEEGGHRVPTGLLGRFKTERSGEHRGELDIKRSGLIFVVEGVRILALLHGIRETPTLKRITALVDGGHIHPDDGEYFEAAYRLLLHFALNTQARNAVENGEVDTYVNPSLLSPREKGVLRHAYKAVSSLQDLIAGEFGQLVV